MLSCTLEWPERSARDWAKLRMVEARALVLVLVTGEQHPADAMCFSAFLAVRTHRQASVQPRKKARCTTMQYFQKMPVVFSAGFF